MGTHLYMAPLNPSTARLVCIHVSYTPGCGGKARFRVQEQLCGTVGIATSHKRDVTIYPAVTWRPTATA